MIDVSSLQNALRSLRTGLELLATKPKDQFVRDACIKRFEYSYELSHKTLRRYPTFRTIVERDSIAWPTTVPAA